MGSQLLPDSKLMSTTLILEGMPGKDVLAGIIVSRYANGTIKAKHLTNYQLRSLLRSTDPRSLAKAKPSAKSSARTKRC
jgi:hypothetical protein